MMTIVSGMRRNTEATYLITGNKRHFQRPEKYKNCDREEFFDALE